MLRDRNIAFFMDVDNVGITSEQYANVIEQLGSFGTILSGKIYGAGERKHKDIYADADLKGYAMARPMRVKRRGRKDFDARIFVDVVDAVARVPAIDAVCVIAQPTDLVHLYSYLRSHGVKIIALKNADDASCEFIDEEIDLGVVVELKPPVKAAPKKPATKPAPKAEPVKPKAAPVEKPAPVEEKDELDRTDELLREIERLRNLANAPLTESAAEPRKPVAQQPVEEEVAPEEEQHVEQAPTSTPRATYTPSNEGDLIRRIEEIRRNSNGDEEELLEEIRKLLDGVE